MTSAIASRKARENLVRLLFPKDPHLAVGRTGTTTTSASSSSSSVTATPTPLWTDRHSHGRRKQQHRQQIQGNASTSGGDPASNSNLNNNQQNNKRHSYSQLRAQYLKKVHAMHPDKIAHKNTTTTTAADTNSTKEDKQSDDNNHNGRNFHLEFIELKNAWEEYHTSVRIIRGNKIRSSPSDNYNYKQQQGDVFWEEDEEEDNFTMFGVGCSFADSPTERDLRNDIMDQACRGWFSSGSIAHHLTSIDNNGDEYGKTQLLASNDGDDTNGVGGDTDTTIPQEQHGPIKLSDDDMFVRGDNEGGGDKESKRRFLVQDVNRFRRKR